MKCPYCGNKFSNCILDPDAEIERCEKCHKHISLANIKRYAEKEDCPLVQSGEYDAKQFDFEYRCDDCHASCILACQEDDFDMVQDEEENWVYPEDLNK